MKQLHVISHDTYAQGLTAGTSTMAAIASLADGAFAIFDKDPQSANYNVCVDAANATDITALPSKFLIATKGKNGVKMALVTRDLAMATALAAVAAVAKVMFVGNQTSGGTTYSLNLPTLSPGDIAGITVTNLEKPVGSLAREKAYNYTVKSGDTAANIVAGIIALVNADSLKCVTAAVAYSNATDGFKLTGAAGKHFQVSPNGILRSASITDQDEGVEVVVPQGAVADVLNLEKFDLVERGLTNGRISEDTETMSSDVVSGKTYDVLVIHGKSPNLRPFEGGTNETQRLVLAVQSDLSAAGTGNTKKAVARIAAII